MRASSSSIPLVAPNPDVPSDAAVAPSSAASSPSKSASPESPSNLKRAKSAKSAPAQAADPPSPSLNPKRSKSAKSAKSAPVQGGDPPSPVSPVDAPARRSSSFSKVPAESVVPLVDMSKDGSKDKVAQVSRSHSLSMSEHEERVLESYSPWVVWLSIAVSYVLRSRMLLFTAALVVFFQLQVIMVYSIFAVNLVAGEITLSVLWVYASALPLLTSFFRLLRLRSKQLAFLLGCITLVFRATLNYVDGEARAGCAAAGVGFWWLWFAQQLKDHRHTYRGRLAATKRADDFTRALAMAVLINLCFRNADTTRDITYHQGKESFQSWAWLVILVMFLQLFGEFWLPTLSPTEEELANMRAEQLEKFAMSELGINHSGSGCLAFMERCCLQIDSIVKFGAGPRFVEVAGVTRTFVLCTGLTGVLLFLYTGFLSPVSMARWAWVDSSDPARSYVAVSTLVAIMFGLFVLGSYANVFVRWRCLRRHGDTSANFRIRMRRIFCLVLVPLNILFLVCYVMISQQQQPIPRDFSGPQEEESPGQAAALYGAILLSPVVLVNMTLLMREIFYAAAKHPRTVAFGIALSNLIFYSFLVLLVFTISDSQDSPIPSGSRRWRDQFTFITLVLGTFAFVPILFVRINLAETARLTTADMRDEERATEEIEGEIERLRRTSTTRNGRSLTEKQVEERVDKLRIRLTMSEKDKQELKLYHLSTCEAWQVRVRALIMTFVVIVLVVTSIGFTMSRCRPVNHPDFDGNTPRTDGRLRLMTYNIHLGFDRWGNPNLLDMANEIRDVQADVIALTESDAAPIHTGMVDAVLFLAEELGYAHHYYGAFTGSGMFGVAMISRFPIQGARTYFVPGTIHEEVFTKAVVAVPVGPDSFVDYTIFVAHCNTDQFEGKIQMRKLTTFANPIQAGGGHVIIAGDYNFQYTARSGAYNVSTAVFDEAWAKFYGTEDHAITLPSGDMYRGWTNKEMRGRIDMFFFSPHIQVANLTHIKAQECMVCRRLGQTSSPCRDCSESDHLPIWADFYVPSGANSIGISLPANFDRW